MIEPVLSPRARVDIETIWDDSRKRWGVDQAEAYTRGLWKTIEALASRPALGRPCPEIRAGYYRFRSGSHIIFYRWAEGRLNVVRILHGRMNFGRHV